MLDAGGPAGPEDAIVDQRKLTVPRPAEGDRRDDGALMSADVNLFSLQRGSPSDPPRCGHEKGPFHARAEGGGADRGDEGLRIILQGAHKPC